MQDRAVVQHWADVAAQHQLSFVYANCNIDWSFHLATISNNYSTTDMHKMLDDGIGKAFPNPLPTCLCSRAGDLSAADIEAIWANQNARRHMRLVFIQ